MAAVVTTTTINRKSVMGNRRAVFATLAFDTGDYAAGGVAITPAQFGLRHIDFVTFAGQAYEVSATPTANLPQWDRTNSKIVFYQDGGTAGTPLAEKGAEAFGSGASVEVFVIGH